MVYGSRYEVKRDILCGLGISSMVMGGRVKAVIPQLSGKLSLNH